jgi:adenylate cyclase
MALHGNIGSRSRMEWGLIGDEVNLAARLESMCKQYGVEILISGQMRARLGDRFLVRPLDRVVAVGKTVASDVFELVAAADGAGPGQRRFCEDFGAVVAAYRRREFGEARRRAAAFLEEFPGDVSACKYVRRCDELLARPPQGDWDGVEVLSEK